MADSHTRLPDDTQQQGKKMQTYLNIIGADDVHAEAVTIVTSSGAPTTIDDLDNTPVSIDFVHHEIHEGNHYTSTVVDLDVDVAAPKYFRLTTPATGAAHLVFAVSGDAGFLVEFYENPTLNAAGAAVSRINNNRISGNTADVTVFQDTTTQAPNNDGTLLWSAIAGAGGNPSQTNSGQTGSRKEFILAVSEDYIIKVTSLANDTLINILAEWYEA